MPTYSYLCPACETQFSKSMSFEQYEKVKNKKPNCPTCGKKSYRHITVAPKITFKGKGFYSNDSKNKKSSS